MPLHTDVKQQSIFQIPLSITICPAFYSEPKQALLSLRVNTNTNKKEAWQPVATPRLSFKALFLFSYIIDDKEKCLYLTPFESPRTAWDLEFVVRKRNNSYFSRSLYYYSRHPIGAIVGNLVISSLLLQSLAIEQGEGRE